MVSQTQVRLKSQIADLTGKIQASGHWEVRVSVLEMRKYKPTWGWVSLFLEGSESLKVYIVHWGAMVDWRKKTPVRRHQFLLLFIKVHEVEVHATI